MAFVKRLKIRVRGRVQGVYYRKSCAEAARRFRIKGWVANEADGSVAIEAEGEEPDLQGFLDWCREGPPMARVSAVEVSEPDTSESQSSFVGFEIRY